MSESTGTILAPSVPLPPSRKLADPADFQRPITYYVGVVRQHLGRIALVTTALTILGIAVCAVLPEINSATAMIAVDRQAQPERVGDDKLLTTGDDQYMATQMNLLQADSVIRPVAEKYNLRARAH